MRKMHPNSLASYEAITSKLPKKRLDCFNKMVELEPATMFDVADSLRVPVHTISGRFTEMSRDKLLKSTGSTKDKKTIFAVNWGLFDGKI